MASGVHGTETTKDGEGALRTRHRQVRRVLVVEGLVNVLILGLKVGVGLATGSFVILGDALHSLADVANNVVAYVAQRVAEKPPDTEHPYGHRKFETLAVFGLAGLLTVTSFEVAVNAFRAGDRGVETGPWSLGIMLVVLGANIGISAWQGMWARRLDSDILRADARHTLGDVLTTVAVILGWQLAAAGYVWLDTLFALVVAGVVLVLAYGLFRRSVPVLVDGTAVHPERMESVIETVPGVREVSRVRSRQVGSSSAADVVVAIPSNLSVTQGHEIATEIERVLHERLGIADVTVHVEPQEGGA